MTAPKTAEEWGRLAVSLPGWRWLPGMSFGWEDDRKGTRICNTHVNHFRVRVDDGVVQGTHTGNGAVTIVLQDGRVSSGSIPWPHPDDPATAGCLLALLGPGEWGNVAPGGAVEPDGEGWWAWIDGKWSEGLTLGRACIAAAAALGRWPGGEG